NFPLPSNGPTTLLDAIIAGLLSNCQDCLPFNKYVTPKQGI
ncbi:MAG: hypothetical protein K0R18_1878, partial [Bacillales bacterium]|nr:hypothetical protein [Bacillales bacterium]